MEKLIQQVFIEVCKTLNVDPNSVNANLHFVDSDEIAELNKIHRGKDAPTDVLSFPMIELTPPEIPTTKTHPFDVNPESGKIELGDIIICEEVAKSQSIEYGHSLHREIAFLYVHGMLHLLGYDHEDDESEKVMINLTEKILEGVGLGR